MPAILTLQNVEKSFGSRRVLSSVSCAVHERDRIGLVGLNGAGKSTLLRMMVGPQAAGTREDVEPDAGLITRQRALKLEYVPQEPRLEAGRTVLATLREGLGADDRDHEIHELGHALGLPPMGGPVDTLSGGEARRVALARALLRRPELLALDEPTNHLDASTVEWLEERLRALPGALVLVTHDRYFLDRVATRILELDRGTLYPYEGGYTAFLEKQAERLANESVREEARRSFVRRELDWIRRGPQARTTKQQARIDRFDAAVAAAPTAGDRRSGPMTLRLSAGGRLGKSILELRGLSAARGGRALFTGLDLIMKPGDRIGVVGPNGAGKTTLLKVLLGLEPPDHGEVVVGQNTRPSYLDQARAQLREDASVLEEVAGDGEHVFLEGGPVHVRTFLRMLLFDDRAAEAKVRTLSGGERNRVLLARLLRQGGNLLVLDEPTNDLDLVTLGVLEDALAAFGGCVLVVSHDRWFLDKVATAILAFEDHGGEGRVTLYEGDYSSYLARRRAAEAPAPPQSLRAERGSRTRSAPPAEAERPIKLSWKEKEELRGMEPAIEAAEAKVVALEAQLNDPAFYKDRGAEVPAAIAELEAARAEVERLYARWQALEGRPT
jgi:ATP-binding cassette subfamily F protein uup